MNINEELESLITLLQAASNKTAKLTGGYSGNHLSVEEFHAYLMKSINQLRQKDFSVLDNLWGWFAPTCQWDDFVGDVEMGDSIFRQIDKIRRAIK